MTNDELRKEYEADLAVFGKDAWKYWEERPDVETEQNTSPFPWYPCGHPILWEDDMEYRRSPDAPSREEWVAMQDQDKCSNCNKPIINISDVGISQMFEGGVIYTCSECMGRSEQDKCDPLKEKPCSHKGCQHHVTHPCEGCGRLWIPHDPSYRRGFIDGQKDKCAGCRHSYEPDIMVSSPPLCHKCFTLHGSNKLCAKPVNGPIENDFFECPYDKIVECKLKEPCLYCEVFNDYINKK